MCPRWFLIALAASTPLLVQCGGEPPRAQGANAPLRIGIDLWAGYYPLVLAEELGYLAEENVSIDVRVPRDTDGMLAEFAAHGYDAVAVSLADVVTLTRTVPDLRLVILSDESAGGDVIFARSPVSRGEDLRGKRIATNLGGFGELFVRDLLLRHGLSAGDVELVNVEAANVPEQLGKGRVDLGHTWEPYASQARAQGMTPVLTSADTPGLIMDGLICRGAVLDRRGDEVRGLCRAWFRAVDWWQANEAEGERRIERRLGLQPGDAKPAGIRILTAAENRRQMHGGSAAPLARVANRYVDFFVARGMLLRRPEGCTLFDPGFLP
jgi:NitT/TauT family transport system substrate-binding protein